MVNNNFILDPCKLLPEYIKRYKSKLFQKTSSNIHENIEDEIPVMTRIGKTMNMEYNDTNCRLKLNMGSAINSGTYGDIYSCTMNLNGKSSKVVVKFLKEDAYEFAPIFFESLVQAELYCKYSSKWKLTHMRIPKIFALAMYKQKLMLVMENLDGDLLNFIDSANSNSEELFITILDLAILLKHLQKDMQYMHRDLHTGNVMFKKNGKKYIWYLIDFGFSRLVNKNVNVDTDFQKDMYKTNTYNMSNDLRMYLVDLFETLIETKELKKKFATVIRFLLPFVHCCSFYASSKEKTLFHNLYEEVVKINDDNFKPNHVIESCKNPKNMVLKSCPKKHTSSFRFAQAMSKAFT